MVTVCFDTSVVVAAIIAGHPHHAKAFDWLQRAKNKKLKMIVSTHTLAEVFSVLTRLPVLSPKISPGMAEKLIHETIENIADCVALNVSDYKSAIQRMVGLDLSGSVIFDGLIIAAAKKAKADHVLTFNGKHFRKIVPEEKKFILTP